MQGTLRKSYSTSAVALSVKQKQALAALQRIHSNFLEATRAPMHDFDALTTRERRVQAAKDAAVASVMANLSRVAGGGDVAAGLPHVLARQAMAKSASEAALPPSPARFLARAAPADEGPSPGLLSHTSRSGSMPTGDFPQAGPLPLVSSWTLLAQTNAARERRQAEAGHEGSVNGGDARLSVLVAGGKPGTRASGGSTLTGDAAAAGGGGGLGLVSQLQQHHDLVERSVVADVEDLVEAALEAHAATVAACTADFRAGLVALLDAAREHSAWLRRRHEREVRELRLSVVSQVEAMVRATRHEVDLRAQAAEDRHAQVSEARARAPPRWRVC
jgi:hypothetical protein